MRSCRRRALALILIFSTSLAVGYSKQTVTNKWGLSPPSVASSSSHVSNQSYHHDDENSHKTDTCEAVVAKFDARTSQRRACKAVLDNDNCQDTDAYGNYVNFLYCTLPGVQRMWTVLGGIILIIYMLYLFIIVGVAADDFFCPSLEVLSELLHMSQNIAGVTFLAFGNGAPDVFSSIAGVSVGLTAEPTLSMGALLGGGLFVSSVVAGSVYILSAPSFDMSQRPFLRDIVFYIGSVVWMLFVLWRGSISQLESIMFLVVYVIYALVVVAGRIVWVKWLKSAEIVVSTSTENVIDAETNDTGKLTHTGSKKHKTFLEEEQKNDDERRAVQLLMRPHTRFGENSRRNSRHNSFRRAAHASVQRHRSNFEQQRRRSSAVSAQPPGALFVTDSPVVSPWPASSHLNVPISSTSRRASLPTIPASPLSITTLPSNTRQFDLFTTRTTEYGRADRLPASGESPPKTYAENPSIFVVPATPNADSFLNNYFNDDADKGGVAVHNEKPQLIFSAVNSNQSSLRRRRSSARQHHLNGPDALPQLDDAVLVETNTTSIAPDETVARPTAWWLDVLEHIWPMTSDYWNSLAWYGRILAVLKLPVQVLLLITVPLVDPAEPITRNWCKWLQTFQLAISPVLCVMVSFGVTDKTLFGVAPLWAAVAVVSCALALILALITRRDHVPRYHSLFSLVGFLVAVVWIYKTANEIVGVLTALGVSFRISPALLGLSLLAWGNSVPDYVADVALARQGFAGVGISACYAGPLFNILVGMGLSFTIATAQVPGRVIKFHAGPVSLLLCFSVLAVQVLTLVGVPLQRFRVRKAFGFVLLGTYLVLLILLILTELDVLPTKFSNQ